MRNNLARNGSGVNEFFVKLGDREMNEKPVASDQAAVSSVAQPSIERARVWAIFPAGTNRETSDFKTFCSLPGQMTPAFVFSSSLFDLAESSAAVSAPTGLLHKKPMRQYARFVVKWSCPANPKNPRQWPERVQEASAKTSIRWSPVLYETGRTIFD